MKSIQHPDNPDLIWRRGMTFHKSFNLISQDNVVGRLRFEQGLKTSLAETAEGKWIFRNTYLTSPHISVWTPNHEFVAMFEVNRFGRGTLLIQDGRRMKWEKAKKNHDEWYFQNLIDERIIKFLPQNNRKRVRGSAYLYPESHKYLNCTLFVLLGLNIISVLEAGRNIKLITEKHTPW